MYAQTASAMPRADRLTNAVRRAVERLLPWYDPENAEARHRRTEEIRLAAIRARQRAEITEQHVYAELDSYRRAAKRLEP